ncbi:hypothetical protein FA821_13335 [Salmonella enterica]|nr:hypothetical protein [Salmonella enterica]
MAEYKLNYPITTDRQIEFWGSRHIINRVKSIIAFSLDLENANNNLRRVGRFPLGQRDRFIRNFGKYVNQPDMINIPFSPEVSDRYDWWVTEIKN